MPPCTFIPSYTYIRYLRVQTTLANTRIWQTSHTTHDFWYMQYVFTDAYQTLGLNRWNILLSSDQDWNPHSDQDSNPCLSAKGTCALILGTIAALTFKHCNLYPFHGFLLGVLVHTTNRVEEREFWSWNQLNLLTLQLFWCHADSKSDAIDIMKR